MLVLRDWKNLGNSVETNQLKENDVSSRIVAMEIFFEVKVSCPGNLARVTLRKTDRPIISSRSKFEIPSALCWKQNEILRRALRAF